MEKGSCLDPDQESGSYAIRVSFRFGWVWCSRSLGIFGEGYSTPSYSLVCVDEKGEIFNSIIHSTFVCCERIYICGSMLYRGGALEKYWGSGEDSERAK
jgi:hypothetical protein